jgi:hypothetical protein
MRDLEQAWHQRHGPIVKGLLFPDGVVIPIAGWPPGSGPPQFGRRTTLKELDVNQPVEWTVLGQLAQAVSADGTLRAVAGEGGMGGDGFVALEAVPDGRLLWLAFFDDTNPFETIRFEDGFVAAATNLGREFRFPVADPRGLVLR